MPFNVVRKDDCCVINILDGDYLRWRVEGGLRNLFGWETLVVLRCSNTSSRFLAMKSIGGGSQNGMLIIPEGKAWKALKSFYHEALNGGKSLPEVYWPWKLQNA